MNKRVLYFVFAVSVIAGVSSSMTSCKKGENDPFLSLRSRRARISGDWKLTEGTLTNVSNFGGTLVDETTTYNETTITTDGSSVPYTETLTIGEDGTYTSSVTEDGENVTISGVWFFAGKIRDLKLKNKESIVLSPQEYSEPGYAFTQIGLYDGEPLIIDRLANDELIFKGESSYGPASNGSNSTYEKKFAKQ